MNEERQAPYDPGLTQQYMGPITRTIRDDGQFAVRRLGTTFRDTTPYLHLVGVSWPKFIGFVLLSFLVLNLFFASLYMAIGIQHLKGSEAPTLFLAFCNAFFFSAHTLTTVGYGNIYPVGILSNTIAAVEALTGLMLFAIATGLLFGRFSRPSARLGFSRQMLIAPYGPGQSLQLRVVNRRTNNLLELGARVLLMTVESSDGQLHRKFAQLQLERENIAFLPLTWTIVHPITPESPLYGKTQADLANLQAEFLVAIRAFEETFGQTVNSRRSYRHDEIVWSARFTPAFLSDEKGEVYLEVDKVSSHEMIEAPAPPPVS